MKPSVFRVLHPMLYQGRQKKSPYFEGWYFKQVSAGNVKARTFSVIPGISKSEDGDTAFIQTMCGSAGSTRFFSFPFSDFSYSDRPFEIRIGPNRFSLGGICLDLEDESGSIRAELRYHGMVPPRSSLFKPGVMGLYALTPFLGCRHGIASLHNEVEGSASFSGEIVSFSGGHGYIEKNWGRSMPSSWIWMQSNNFSPAVGPASFSFGIVRVPWLGSPFVVFVCLLWLGDREYRFATYTGARVELLESGEGSTRILLSDRAYKVEIQLRRPGKSGLITNEWENLRARIFAPVDDALHSRVVEMVESSLRIILKRRHGSAEDIIMDAATTLATAEIAGDVSELAP